jgi:hypothetical protein
MKKKTDCFNVERNLDEEKRREKKKQENNIKDCPISSLMKKRHKVNMIN